MPGLIASANSIVTRDLEFIDWFYWRVIPPAPCKPFTRLCRRRICLAFSLGVPGPRRSRISLNITDTFRPHVLSPLPHVHVCWHGPTPPVSHRSPPHGVISCPYLNHPLPGQARPPSVPNHRCRPIGPVRFGIEDIGTDRTAPYRARRRQAWRSEPGIQSMHEIPG